MANISGEFSEKAVADVLKEYAKVSGAGSDLSRPMKTIGQVLKTRIKLGFSGSVDPYGNKWKGIKNRRGKPLRDTGRLMNSIVYKASKNSVVVGTNVEYARMHQFGGKGTVNVKAHKRVIKKAFGRKLSSPKSIRVSAHQKKQTVVARMFIPSEKKGIPNSWQQFIINRISKHILN